MSKSVNKIRRKSDGKILIDIINDSCQVHNIFNNGKNIGSYYEWEIDYDECNQYRESSPYEFIESVTFESVGLMDE